MTKVDTILSRAFLRRIQEDGSCIRKDGFVCREPSKCGCFLEMMICLREIIEPAVVETTEAAHVG